MFVNVFRSKRFLTLLLDTVISISLHFWGGEDVRFLVITLQPIFAMLILMYGLEDLQIAKTNPFGLK